MPENRFEGTTALSGRQFVRAATQPIVSTAIGEDKGRFQVALLTLGATHAHFGHTQEALSALNESVRRRTRERLIY